MNGRKHFVVTNSTLIHRNIFSSPTKCTFSSIKLGGILNLYFAKDFKSNSKIPTGANRSHRHFESERGTHARVRIGEPILLHTTNDPRTNPTTTKNRPTDRSDENHSGGTHSTHTILRGQVSFSRSSSTTQACFDAPCEL